MMVLTAVASLGIFTLSAGVASANTLYPAGCTQWAEWIGYFNQNCWLGYSYVNSADYVEGVQLALSGLGYNPYSNHDGLWGPTTNSAVEAYQRARGLSADGIVGSQTWLNMGDDLIYKGPICNYGGVQNTCFDYYGVGQAAAVYFWAYSGVYYSYWFTYEKTGTNLDSFSVQGPY